jgi:deoxyribodipyrimidine photo-lyase
MMETCVFIFRRDFRLHDNTAFIESVKVALESRWNVLPIFIFNSKQISPSLNPYYCNAHVQFMVESLESLENEIAKSGNGRGKLIYFHTSDEDTAVLNTIAKKVNVRAVAFNADITPFARHRDTAIKTWCEKNNITALVAEDYTLLPIEHVKTKTGKTFEVYTPYYRKAIHLKIAEPRTCPTEIPWCSVAANEFPAVNPRKYYNGVDEPTIAGGRHKALDILEGLKRGTFRTYKKQREVPSKQATTRLSAYIKFGCVSIREVYHVGKLSQGRGSVFVQQLFWREYYYNLAFSYPEILRGQVNTNLKNTPVHGRYEKKEWKGTDGQFKLWCDGQTGVPIVDAAMRCLNQTGWMHNRLRMVVAMFLVRTLDVDWRKGERYFAQHLVDYDPVNNNQGWCWALSYRRQLNPYKQTGRFDPDCIFIKEWVPELKTVPVLDIITWWEKSGDYKETGYPSPMLDIAGYRVKFKRYVPDYKRPKDPNLQKKKKMSKYAGGVKNTSKYLPKKPPSNAKS